MPIPRRSFLTGLLALPAAAVSHEQEYQFKEVSSSVTLTNEHPDFDLIRLHAWQWDEIYKIAPDEPILRPNPNTKA